MDGRVWGGFGEEKRTGLGTVGEEMTGLEIVWGGGGCIKESG